MQGLEEPEPQGAEEDKVDGQQEYLKNVVLDSLIDGMAPETTGKFGTGFLTTHLLSRIVQIGGIFTAFKDDDPLPDDQEAHRYQKFDLLLDRSTKDKKQMIKNYQVIYELLKNFDNPETCPYVPDYVPGQACDSSFKYVLDERGR